MEPSATSDEQLQAEVLETTPEPSEESSGADTENQQEGSVDDYLEPASEPEKVEAKPEEEDVKKRYAESSREAKRLVEENKRLAAELESLKKGAVVPETVSKDIEFLKSVYQDQAKENATRDIKMFEAGKNITAETRKKMQPIVSRLIHPVRDEQGRVVQEPMKFDQALETAWAVVSQGQATEQASRKATAQAIVNQTATFQPSGKANQTQPTSQKLPKISQEEMAYMRRMGVVNEDGTIKESYLKELAKRRV